MPTTPQLLQFHLQDGAPTQDGPYIGADSDDPGKPASFSYSVLIEPLCDDAQGWCAGAVETILRHLRRRRGGVTSALERGALAVHQQLQQEQRAHQDGPPAGLGLACAALRGRELYLGLAGPTIAMLISNDGVETLSGTATGGSRRGLGIGREPVLRLYRRELDPSAIVLLAFSSVRSSVATAVLAEIAPDGPGAVLAQVYRNVLPGAEGHFAAAVVIPEGVARFGLARPINTGAHPVAAPPEGVEPASGASVASRTLAAPPIPQLPESLGLELRSPRRIQSRRLRSLTMSPFALAVTGTILAALAVGLVLWYLQAQAATSREARHAALQREATASYEAALTAPSRDAMRQKLLQSRDVADAATTLQRDVPETATLLEAIQARLTELNAATALAEPKVLADLRLNAAVTTAFRDPVLLGPDLTVLDEGADRIYRLPAGETAWRPEAPPALTPGRGGSPRGLRRLFWMPKGGLWQHDALLAFDESRILWEYRGGGSAPAGPAPAPSPTPSGADLEWRRVPLRGAAAWEAFQGAQGFNGNLYVLDPPSSQVWRYVPTDSGFDSERTGVLTAGGDLREAVDFAVDGDIYVLLRSGKVLKFSGGRPQGYPMDGLDRRLSGPAALFTSPDARGVYVADNGNQRVVVFDKVGVFQRQVLLPDSLPPLTDLLADETRGLLYLVGGRAVVVASLR